MFIDIIIQTAVPMSAIGHLYATSAPGNASLGTRISLHNGERICDRGNALYVRWVRSLNHRLKIHQHVKAMSVTPG